MKKYLFLSIMSSFLVAGCVESVSDGSSYKDCNDLGDDVYYCKADELCGKGQCIPISNDNCGAVGTVCNNAEQCLQYADQWYCGCVAAGGMQCPQGDTCCATGCAKLSSNIDNCGACGIKCAPGQTCVNGACSCPIGTSLCDDTCMPASVFQSNIDNCGACGIKCPDAEDLSLNVEASFCQDSRCQITCKAGYFDQNKNVNDGCEYKRCGNNFIDPGEICDGTALNGKSCADFMPGATGDLLCNDTCSDYITTGCKPGTVEPPQQCTNNATQCNGKFIETCTNGQWIKATSECDNGCENGKCVTPVCTEKATQCNDKYVETCTNGKWVKATSECTNGCENGKCIVVPGVTVDLKNELSSFSHSAGDYYSVTHTKTLDNGVQIEIKGNAQKAGLYMNNTSYIKVTGLKSPNRIWFSYKSNKGSNGYTFTAGSFIKTVSNIGSGTAEEPGYDVDETVTSFTIDGVKQQALIIYEIGWK